MSYPYYKFLTLISNSIFIIFVSLRPSSIKQFVNSFGFNYFICSILWIYNLDLTSFLDLYFHLPTEDTHFDVCLNRPKISLQAFSSSSPYNFDPSFNTVTFISIIYKTFTMIKTVVMVYIYRFKILYFLL